MSQPPFAQLLKLARKAIGISQGELAERIGVSTRRVSEWEKGHGEPSLEQMERLDLILPLRLAEPVDPDEH